ncbi:uncharacterized protein LOC117104179 [Anneissia japonica]|uniref:uncharacterized protein LOC117104179 n=1 Tax=Anneissia japonica TaxID=1529436 RepID=UPI00142552B5|nr:uncharacterized protein LOC117104179 [Anneissia japonica]
MSAQSIADSVDRVAAERFGEDQNDVFSTVVLRPWQQGLMDELSRRPDPRAVYWYHEPHGNVGKSFMASYLSKSSDEIVFDGCKKGTDGAYAYDGHRIVVFDLHRSQKKRVNYELMERFKNGRLFSPKYHSKVKLFAVTHVVVFANFPPDLRAMSADRWRIRKIGSDGHELNVSNHGR